MFVHNFFAFTDSLTLLDVLTKRVTLLLKAKENEATLREHASDWLTKDVSAIEYVLRAGTFRFLNIAAFTHLIDVLVS